MRASIWSVASAAIVFGLTVGTMAQQRPTDPAAQRMSPKSITISGCIQRAELGPTGTSGTAGTTPDASETKFLLTGAAMSSAGTTGTAGTASDTTVAPTYRLDADDAKLTPHVGHKVEIAGTVEQPSKAMPTPSPAASTSAPKLKVDTVRMIAASCS
jgi:hypothetical protein